MKPPPRAFISYSWEDEPHSAWVKDFAIRLRKDGVEVTLDQWHVAPGDPLPPFMEESVRTHDFVLIVCTPRYKTRSDQRLGGVGYEADIMIAEISAYQNDRKFIPILRRGEWGEAAPSWLLDKYYVDLRGDPFSENRYQDLLARLHGLGENPPAVDTATRIAAAVGDLQASTAVPILMNLLQSEEVPDRVEAARNLGRYGAEAAPAAGLLADLLEHPSEELRLEAAFSLGAIGTPAAPWLPVLIRSCLVDASKGVRDTAFGVLDRLDPEGKARIPRLLEALADDSLQSIAAGHLARLGPRCVEPLLDSLGPHAGSLVPVARQILLKMEGPVIPKLLSGLGHRNALACRLSLELFRSLDPAVEADLKELGEILAHDSGAAVSVPDRFYRLYYGDDNGESLLCPDLRILESLGPRAASALLPVIALGHASSWDVQNRDLCRSVTDVLRSMGPAARGLLRIVKSYAVSEDLQEQVEWGLSQLRLQSKDTKDTKDVKDGKDISAGESPKKIWLS